MLNGPVSIGSSSSSSLFAREALICVLLFVGVSSMPIEGVKGLAGVFTGVWPACALYSLGIGDAADHGEPQGISSTFKLSSAKETTELLRGFKLFKLLATVSMRGISIVDGAPSLRCDRVNRGSTFSSSAMLGRTLAPTKRVVGGEAMLLLPLFGDIVGDFAGLKLCQLSSA